MIRRYTEESPGGKKYAALSSALGTLPWEKPLSSEFEQLARYMVSTSPGLLDQDRVLTLIESVLG